MKNALIAERILSTFRVNWQELSWIKQRHFSYRAQLVSDDRFWLDAFLSLEGQTRDQLFRLKEYGEDASRDCELIGPPIVYADKPNDLGKRVFWERYPEIGYWDDYFTHLKYLYLYTGSVKDDILTQRSYLKFFERRTMEEIVRLAPVWGIELAYNLKWLVGDEKTEELREVFEQVYRRVKQDADVWNMMYGLTHFVLGESRFYRDCVSSQFWAARRLVTAFNRYSSRLSVDLMAEVGVCLKLTGTLDEVDNALIFDTIQQTFVPGLGRLVRTESGLNASEHRNAMAVMYLCSK